MHHKPASIKEVKAFNTRRNIIRAATKLFARQGYHKTTISDIAREIELTTGAVFHHFPTKEAILEAVIEWLSKGMMMYADFLAGKQQAAFEVVTEMIRTMLSHYDRHPEATICLAMLSTEFAGSNHPVEKRLKAVYEPFLQNAARLFSQYPGIANPRAAAIAILGAAHGIGIQGLFREGETNAKSIAEALISFILHPWARSDPSL
ncbi:MAG: TetR/AcrR family transcriptional regulator [Thermodesulfobacteriota bacterium]